MVAFSAADTHFGDPCASLANGAISGLEQQDAMLMRSPIHAGYHVVRDALSDQTRVDERCLLYQIRADPYSIRWDGYRMVG